MSSICAFDVDGCLIDFHDNPEWYVIETLKNLKRMGCTIYVWSGGGKSYAESWVRRLFLTAFVDKVMEKPRMGQEWLDENKPDITFDDEFVLFGKVNIKLPTQA